MIISWEDHKNEQNIEVNLLLVKWTFKKKCALGWRCGIVSQGAAPTSVTIWEVNQ